MRTPQLVDLVPSNLVLNKSGWLVENKIPQRTQFQGNVHCMFVYDIQEFQVDKGIGRALLVDLPCFSCKATLYKPIVSVFCSLPDTVTLLV